MKVYLCNFELRTYQLCLKKWHEIKYKQIDALIILITPRLWEIPYTWQKSHQTWWRGKRDHWLRFTETCSNS